MQGRHQQDRSSDPPVEHAAVSPRWGERTQDVAVVVWASFLAACVASVVFFGIVDPLALADITTPALEFSRMAGYALGFFFFWAVTAAASLLTCFMLRTATRSRR